MAGHSHSANIAIRKGAQDKKRAKLFSKLAKEIIVACKVGDPDPDSNPRLRLALRKARAQSLPKNTIDRAIKKGSGDMDGEDYQELVMEGYGPGGTAVYLEILTDNRNRAASEIRHAFSKNGGNLGTTGCVGYMFNRKGVITVEGGEDAIMIAALESGAEDVSENDDGSWEVLTEATDCEDVVNKLTDAGVEVTKDEVIFIPDNRVAVEGKEAQQLLRMLDALDDCDDVQNVTHNAEIPQADIDEFTDS